MTGGIVKGQAKTTGNTVGVITIYVTGESKAKLDA